jgi:NADPH2:quinone reductase
LIVTAIDLAGPAAHHWLDPFRLHFCTAAFRFRGFIRPCARQRMTSFPIDLESKMTSPSLMHALVTEAADASFHLAKIPVPALRPGHVLVKVMASGVNPLDSKIRQGAAAHARQPLPAVLGIDMAGVVETVAEDVTRFRRGDKVYGMSGGVGGLQGSLAEYQLVDADLLARMPANLSMREAAALPLVTITAWEGLVDRARVSAGQKVLVHGGAGGIGHVAVQLARARGAKVFATGTQERFPLIERFGAVPIDYETTTVAEYVDRHTQGEGFDVVFDTVGGATLDASFEAARRYGGHVVSALGWGTHKLAPLSFRAATYSGIFTLIPLQTGRGRAAHGHILQAVARLVELGLLTPLLDGRTFGLDTALDAHQIVERGQARGKVVVDIPA